jgi:hypothetical protein
MYNTKIVSFSREAVESSGAKPLRSYGYGENGIKWTESERPQLHFSDEHYLKVCSRQKGEEDLRKLADYGSDYGAFMFIPGMFTWLSMSTPGISPSKTSEREHFHLIDKELLSMGFDRIEEPLIVHYSCISRQFLYPLIRERYKSELVGAGHSPRSIEHLLNVYTFEGRLLPSELDIKIALLLNHNYPEKTFEFVSIAEEGRLTMRMLKKIRPENFQGIAGFVANLQDKVGVSAEKKDASQEEQVEFLLSSTPELVLEEKVMVLNNKLKGLYEFSYEPFWEPLLSD